MSRIVLQQTLEALESTGRFLHHCWCAVSMNDYSFDELNKQIKTVDAEIAFLREELAKPESDLAMWAYRSEDGTYCDASGTHHSKGMYPLYSAPTSAQAADTKKDR